MTATFATPRFNEIAKEGGFGLYEKPRGSPLNVGSTLRAEHPVVRTNQVTGWKSVFPVGGHVRNINVLTQDESRSLLDWFVDLVYKNHDLTVRFQWRNPNDIAIWDNRSVYHAATPDYIYDDLGERAGSRAVSLGETPYLDPLSTTRREALNAEALAAAADQPSTSAA